MAKTIVNQSVKKAVPTSVADLLRQGYVEHGSSSRGPAETQRGKALFVKRGPSRPWPEGGRGCAVLGDILDQIVVPFTAKLSFGRPRRLRAGETL